MKTEINNTQINVWLPKKLFEDLKKKIDGYNRKKKKPKLNLAIAAYLLNLVIYIPLMAKDKYEYGWIPICSKPFKNLKYFKEYMLFLKENKFLVQSNTDYSTLSRKCRKYKFAGTYGKQLITNHPLSGNSVFFKNINETKIERMETADSRCKHLTKWLNPELLTIDYDEAISYTRKQYSTSRKKNTRIYAIESIHNKNWSYSREGKDDRLHSILTSLPKDLRRYIRYNNNELISYDIKNSQPFILSIILRVIIDNSINELSNYLINNKKDLYTSTMSDLFRNNLNFNNLEQFIGEVNDGEFYEKYGEILFNEGVIAVNINNECFYISGTETKTFENRREAAKNLTLLTLYSSENSHQRVIRVFKKHYPEVYKVTQLIKKDRDKNFFPILLQKIEANCVLDFCTKKISENHPEMPLLTIHDSIITTVDFGETLKIEFKKYLKIYYGIEPKLGRELWYDDELPLAS